MNRKRMALALLSISLSGAAYAVDPQEILARAKAAAGGNAWDEVRALHVRATAATGGLSGPTEAWQDLESGHFLSTFILGPIQGADGYDGTSSWSKDPSGQVTVSQSGDAREGSVNEAYRISLAWWYPQRHPAKIEAAGERSAEGRSFQVLRIHPEGGRPFEMWLDTSTWLLDRIVEDTAGETRTTLFSDYRPVGPLKLAFHSLSTNGEAKYDTVIRVESVEVNPAIEAARFSPPQVRTDDVELAGGTSVTIPFELANNHIYVDMFVDGQGPIRTIFDTGGVNLVLPAVAERLGLKPEGTLQATGTGEGSADFSLARVKELRIGSMTLRDQTIFVLPMQDVEKVEGSDVGGLAGFEVLKRLVVRIDYANRRLTLTKPDAFTPPALPEGAAAVPFTFDDRTPQVEGKLDGIPGRFTIDTGSRSSLTVNRPFAEKNGLRAKYGATVEAVTGWGVGGPTRSALARAKVLELGNVAVPGPVTHLSLQQKGSFSDPYLAGNVGGGILKRFTVTFDYGHQVMYLEPNAQADPDVYDRAGLWINRDGDGYAVVDVVPGGPAAEAGLKPGDEILVLDGRSAQEIPLADARARLRDTPGTPVRLTVRSGGASREVTIVLRELI
jgi:PDZ domain/Aspartyl protease